MGQGPEGQGGGGRIPELISTNEKPKKTGPLSPAGKRGLSITPTICKIYNLILSRARGTLPHTQNETPQYVIFNQSSLRSSVL